MTCERCGRANAGTASYCQYCGQVLITSPPIASGSALLCGGCGAENPPGTNFCYACGRRLRMTSASGGNDVGHLPLRARLVAVRRDGTDGASYPFEGDQLDIGRSEGDLLFEDPHLASRHARILRRGGGYVLVPLDTRNGVYVRVTVPTPLDEGDQILLGKQVLRFEVVPDVERNLRPGVEQGVILFGTPVRAPWARLRQMTSAGTTRDVYHLARSEVILGREQGDIVFSDDEFMSRRHAALRARPGGGEVEDAGSSNGTFIRLRREHFLGHGEMIRLGDELLRFELL